MLPQKKFTFLLLPSLVFFHLPEQLIFNPRILDLVKFDIFPAKLTIPKFKFLLNELFAFIGLPICSAIYKPINFGEIN